MSANDYMEAVRKLNPTLFENKKAMVRIRSAQLEAVIKSAYESGVTAGKNSKSVFEQVFGPSIFQK